MLALAIGVLAIVLIGCLILWPTIAELAALPKKELADNNPSRKTSEPEKENGERDGMKKDFGILDNTKKETDLKKSEKENDANGTKGTAEARRSLKLLAPRRIKLPQMESVGVYVMGGVGGFRDHGHVATITSYAEEIRLPSDKKYEIWWKGKFGARVCMVPEISIKEKKIVELYADDYLAIIRVKDQGAPKLKRLVIGPAGGTYRFLNPSIVQSDNQYGRDLVVPAGTYEVHLEFPDPTPRRRLEVKLIVAAGRVIVVE